ncbi:MAG TPA: cytochrome C [Myxococcota bacterium]|nr:cytochrome C [Myxococcota bacterium]
MSQQDPTLPDRVAVWPNLVRVELLVALVATIVLVVWSITIDAPLEGPADPNLTPDPSKAPWYFLGLQELLVYFDPWIAGVMLPGLIIVGLIAIPYLDDNPRGNGFFTLRERPFAIGGFLFGFLGLWVLPILVGVFCRGPGWNWYWPWESWSTPKHVDLSTRDLTDLLGIEPGPVAMVVGGLFVLAWYGQALAFWRWRRAKLTIDGWRYAVASFLFLSMAAIPVKIALRLLLDVKYVWVTPWFNI